MSELVEVARRLKRSLDGYISYRRAAAIAVLILGRLMNQKIYIKNRSALCSEDGRKKVKFWFKEKNVQFSSTVLQCIESRAMCYIRNFH